MPTSKRDLIKRKHTAIANAILRAQGWTVDLHNQFEPVHPQYAEGYANIMVMLEQALVFINKMKTFI